MNSFSSILEKIQNARSLDFGDIFGDAMEVFKKVWLQGLVTLILHSVMAIPLGLILYIPMIFLGIISPESFNNDMSGPNGVEVFTIIMSILMLMVVIVLSMALRLGLEAAYFRIVKIRDLGSKGSDDYFFFLKQPYLKKTIQLGLMMGMIFIGALLLCVLPIFYVMIPISFMVVVYANNPDLETGEILKLGFTLGNKKWWITFLLVIVAWFLSTVVGFLMCFVGIYVTQQFINLQFHSVYKASVGFEEKDEIEEIGLIEQ